eukprot:2266419-Lingulodinium_polyedra.AAC.1
MDPNMFTCTPMHPMRCNALRCTPMHCVALQRTLMHSDELQCAPIRSHALRCIPVHFNVRQAIRWFFYGCLWTPIDSYGIL